MRPLFGGSTVAGTMLCSTLTKGSIKSIAFSDHSRHTAYMQLSIVIPDDQPRPKKAAITLQQIDK